MASGAGELPALLVRTRFSDFSAALRRERAAAEQPQCRRHRHHHQHHQQEHQHHQQQHQKRASPPGMTAEQANRVVADLAALNDELCTVVSNLRARQEESDHIHALLIERAERAAQRIIFLQNRIAYLERELDENDDELQHLRICLKAAEILTPPHPDQELQRCIAAFKRDYQTLRRRRALRAQRDP